MPRFDALLGEGSDVIECHVEREPGTRFVPSEQST